MNNDSIKNSIKSTFDEVAKNYDKNKQFKISAKKMVEILDDEIDFVNEKINILDLSAGTGNISIELAKKYPNATVYAVDLSKEMLNIAEEKAKLENITNIRYVVQDVEKLEFHDMKFEIITCGYGLFFYPNMDDVLHDICSRLTTNGKFLFSTFTKEAFQPYGKMFLDMLADGYDIRPPETIESRLLESEKEIELFLQQESNIKFDTHQIDIKYPMDIKEWWELLNTTGYQGLLGELKDSYKKFEKEYLNSLEKISRNNQIDFNANSFITVVGK